MLSEFKIQSGNPVSTSVVNMITDILAESHCPQQVLHDNIPNYKNFDGHTIQIGNGSSYVYNIVSDALFKDDEVNEQ